MAPQIVYSKRQLFTVGGFESQLVSVDFDGSTEFMANTTNNPLGIANIWSISLWYKADVNGFKNFFGVSNSANNINRIRIQNDSGTGLQIQLWDSAGTERKSFSYAGQLETGAWMNFLFTWDGTDLLAYKNGSLLTPVKNTDNANTMTATDRRVIVGVFNDLSQVKWDGPIHSIAVWDAEISAAASDIYNGGNGGGFDLGSNSGSYTFSGDLQHWWRLGLDSSDIGKDSGLASTLIDVNANSENIDASDIVSDSPS